MAGAIKHMERSHRATAAKRNSGTFNHFYRNAYKINVVKQQKRFHLALALSYLMVMQHTYFHVVASRHRALYASYLQLTQATEVRCMLLYLMYLMSLIR